MYCTSLTRCCAVCTKLAGVMYFSEESVGSSVGIVTRLRTEKREVVPNSGEDKKFILYHNAPRQALKYN